MSGFIDLWTAPTDPALNAADQALADRFTRRVIEDAGQRTKAESHAAARYVFAYARWTLANGGKLDETVIFAAEAVKKYLDSTYGVDDKGTKAAVSSYLKRMAPGIGFAGSTRAAAAKPTAKPAAAMAPEPPTDARPLVIPEIEALVVEWAPTRVPAELWTPGAELVRDAVRRAAPHRPEQAFELLRAGAYHVARLVSADMPLVDTSVFSDHAIEIFIKAVRPRLGGVATDRLVVSLERLRDAVTSRPGTRRRRSAPRAPKAPYSDDELLSLLRDVAHLRSRRRRYGVESFVLLCAQAGARPGEASWVEPDDIRRVGGHLVADLFTPDSYEAGAEAALALACGFDEIEAPEETVIAGRVRTVPVLDAHADRLEALAHQTRRAGDRWLMGGETLDRNRRGSTLLDANKQTEVTFDATRARYSYIVHRMALPGTVAEVLADCDTGWETIARLAPYAAAHTPHAAARTTRTLTYPTGAEPATLESEAGEVA